VASRSGEDLASVCMVVLCGRTRATGANESVLAPAALQLTPAPDLQQRRWPTDCAGRSVFASTQTRRRSVPRDATGRLTLSGRRRHSCLLDREARRCARPSPPAPQDASAGNTLDCVRSALGENVVVSRLQQLLLRSRRLRSRRQTPTLLNSALLNDMYQQHQKRSAQVRPIENKCH